MFLACITNTEWEISIFLWVFLIPVLHLSLCSLKGSNTSGKRQLTNKPMGATVNLQVWLLRGWEEAKTAWRLSDWPGSRSGLGHCYENCFFFTTHLSYKHGYAFFCFHCVNNICTGHVVIFSFTSFCHHPWNRTSLTLDMTTIRPR